MRISGDVPARCALQHVYLYVVCFTDGIASDFGVPTSATTFDVRGTWNFKGGTGRLKGMRGNGTSLGHVNLVTGASPHELIGNITNADSPE